MDDDTRRGARKLVMRYGCSVSEAIRRAILRQRDPSMSVPASARKERTRVLERLFELFEGNDPEEEVERLKQQDQHF